MRGDALPAVPRDEVRRHVLRSLRRYWPRKADILKRLPVAASYFPAVSGPLHLVDVMLPTWATKHGIDGKLCVPHESCANPESPRWQEVDWWLAAFLLLECWHEREWERRHRAIHSYSLRLKGWDARVWERAWVNRIALFLREWAGIENAEDASALLGPLPTPHIVLTHDVDAVAKTWSIRFKQSAFLAFNALRLLVNGDLALARDRVAQSGRFLFRRDDWWLFEELRTIERRAGLRSQFNFYADDRPRSFKRWLFDPGYDVSEPRLSRLLEDLVREGWRVGLHQSFDGWRSAELMRRQRERLQSLLPIPVTSCRQHWLRFSWRDTWKAQSDAGFEEDTTLMFNDRPGFRSAAALSWRPWDPAAGEIRPLRALPTVMMDSHFYDYRPMSDEQRRSEFGRWLGEIEAVGGEGAVLWHPHTISADYGWKDGFLELVGCLKGISACLDS